MSSHHLQPPDDRQARAFAVAKLKRAASLPRIKDGRRPPMHRETATSTDDENNYAGEENPPNTGYFHQGHPNQPPQQSAQESSNLYSFFDSTPATPSARAGHGTATGLEQRHIVTEHQVSPAPSPRFRPPQQPSPHPDSHTLSSKQADNSVNQGMDAEDDYDQEHGAQESSSVPSNTGGANQTESEDAEPESNPIHTTTPTTREGGNRRRKRRSRPRSRAWSKDLTEELHGQSSGDKSAAATVPPPPVPISRFLPASQSPRLPPTLSPQAGERPFLQTPISPFPGNPTSPSSASPLPSLDAIRAGLIRSNSAAERTMAFHKLTGWMESPEPMGLSPSLNFLTRSDTVTGGDRFAARKMMLRRLEERIKEADGETPTIFQESTQTSPGRRNPIPPGLVSPSLRPQFNRSPQMSTATNGVVDDREVSETSPNSPVRRAIPLHLPEREGHESAGPTPIPDTSADQYASTRTGPSTSTSSAFGYTQTTDSSHPEPFEYDWAEVIDGVVIEHDEPDSSRPHLHYQQLSYASQSSSYSVTSPTLGPLPRPQRRKIIRPSDAPSESVMSSPTDNIRENIPLFPPAYGEQAPYKQDTFPVAISPFDKGSIIAESEEEGETTVYHEEMKARKAWPDRAPSSALSLPIPVTVPPPREGVSPVLPASVVDLVRYADQKLKPFPGLAKLQEEKKQLEGKPVAPEPGPIMKTPSPPAEGDVRRGPSGLDKPTVNTGKRSKRAAEKDAQSPSSVQLPSPPLSTPPPNEVPGPSKAKKPEHPHERAEARIPRNSTNPTSATSLQPTLLSELRLSATDTIILDDDIGPAITWISSIPVKINGHFCDLFEGNHLEAGKVALKRPRIDATGYTDAILRRFEREAATWRRLQHPHVLKFLGTFKRGGHIYFVSPFIERGTLVEYIAEHPNVNRIKMLCETADAVQYLHKEEVIHGDLKANNILVGDNGFSMLCDFGLTKSIDSRTSTAMRGAGTLRWQSPELWNNSPKSFESDVYAFGMTIAEVLTGEVPFSDCQNDWAVMYAVMSKDERPSRVPGRSSSGVSYENIWDVASACWPKTPTDRIPMLEALRRIRMDPSLKGSHKS
ncbi:hypothetical protein FS837_007407 [Tulasnella sp. UAMH 9824]|nr:hypothetical protein FS837_007407 [Tulasnella sp. UAMH 9824]